MSKAIMIIGPSGSGKTTSLEHLDPKLTFYIDADGKGLSWKGWRNQYNKANKNYFVCDDPNSIYSLMQQINDKQKQIKYLVIDTLNGCMVADEMRRAKEKAYDKWMDLAQSVYSIVDFSNKMRDDLTVILIGHTQTSDDGLPVVAPCQLNLELIHCGSAKDCESRGVCDECRREFWMQEVT